MSHSIPLGLQLWSLRNETAADAAGTLRSVRGLGFDSIELAGTYGWSAEQWKTLLAETGLRVVGSHIGYGDFQKNLAEQTAFNQAIGNIRYILPGIPDSERTKEGYVRVAKALNASAQAVKSLGGRVYYHNHDFEFQDLGGTHGYEILLKETDPALVGFEVDAYWVEKSGREAYPFIAEHASRIGLIHAKEIRRADKEEVPIGEGDINFTSILSLAKANGWPLVVEFEKNEAPAAVRKGASHLAGILAKMR